MAQYIAGDVKFSLLYGAREHTSIPNHPKKFYSVVAASDNKTSPFNECWSDNHITVCREAIKAIRSRGGVRKYLDWEPGYKRITKRSV